MKKILLTLLLSLGFLGTSSGGEVDTNTMKLKALKSCESCNLQGANLSGANLNGLDLSGANLSSATLCNTKTPWGNDDSGC